MLNEKCFYSYCHEFVALKSDAPKFFGFSEFIAGLALIILVWTIVDVRYKFRIAVAPLPLKGLSFVVVFGVGALTLLTDLWRAQQWSVPVGDWLTPASWQAVLATLFFFTVIVWIWFAFMRASLYGRFNAQRYGDQINYYMLGSSLSDLAIIADEMSHSAMRFITYAAKAEDSSRAKQKKVEGIAYEILLFIANERFCRVVVESSPRLIYFLFDAMVQQNKFQVGLEYFGKNVVSAALDNKASFMFTETDIYQSGWIGHAKPISTAMFSNFDLVEGVGLLLTPNSAKRQSWDVEQWHAYFRIFHIAFSSYLSSPRSALPTAFHFAKFQIIRIFKDVNKLNGLSELSKEADIYLRLNALSEFINSTVAMVDESNCTDDASSYVRGYLVDVICRLIESVLVVRASRSVSRMVQSELVWDAIMNTPELRTPTGKIIMQAVHDDIYKKIINVPALDGARLIGFCLNVMGHAVAAKGPYEPCWRGFHARVIEWVVSNFCTCVKKNPTLAQYCFVEGTYYDEENARIVFEYPWPGKDGAPYKEFLALSPAG